MTTPAAKYGVVTEGRYHWIFRVADNVRLLYFGKEAPVWRICAWMNHLEQRRGLHTPKSIELKTPFSAKIRLNRIKKICMLHKYGEKESTSLLKERFFVFVETDAIEEQRELGGLVKEGISYGE